MRQTTAAIRSGPRPTISLRPAPACEPPFDDELEPAIWSPAHQLTFDWPPSTSVTAGDGTSGRGRRPGESQSGPSPVGGRLGDGLSGPGPVGSRATRHGAISAGASIDDPEAVRGRGGRGLSQQPNGTAGSGAIDGGRGPATLGGLPAAPSANASAPHPGAVAGRSPIAGASREADIAVRRFLRTCVEVLNGYRPPAHLRRLSRPFEAADIVAEGQAGLRQMAALRRAGQRPGRHQRKPVPVGVLCLRLCEPLPGIVEAAAPLLIGDRTWAMALRMELHHQAWAATALQLIHRSHHASRSPEAPADH
jgi:hypothetical protein